jgi:hypothetical protein
MGASWTYGMGVRPRCINKGPFHFVPSFCSKPGLGAGGRVEATADQDSEAQRWSTAVVGSASPGLGWVRRTGPMAGCVKCSKECSRVVGVATRSERDPGPSARIYASPMGRANKCGDPRSCPSNPIWADVSANSPVSGSQACIYSIQRPPPFHHTHSPYTHLTALGSVVFP